MLDSSMGTRRRDKPVLVFLALLLLGAVVLRLAVGEPLPRDAAGGLDRTVLWEYLQLRRDRALIGAVVGGSLAVSGAVLQSLLRNPLACPYLLGVSSGAAVGVMVAWAGWVAVLGVVGTHAAALAGAAATMLIVYLLAQKKGRIDPVGLLLVGVILNAVNAAIILFVNYINPHGLRSDMARWMMGHLDEGVGWGAIVWAAAAAVVCIVMAVGSGRALDIATLSDSEARSLGLNLSRLRLGMFAVCGVLTVLSVVLAGPVGFVGLICPHIVRRMLGPSSRTVVLGSALAGAALVVLADAAVKAASVHLRIGLMPIGVLTAMLGGPTFLALLRPHLGRGME